MSAPKAPAGFVSYDGACRPAPDDVAGLRVDDEGQCHDDATGKGSFRCTRPKGHTGKHYAGVGKGVAIAEWGEGPDPAAWFDRPLSALEEYPPNGREGPRCGPTAEQCRERHPRKDTNEVAWFCNRPVGHEGPHAAYRADDRIWARWPNVAPGYVFHSYEGIAFPGASWHTGAGGARMCDSTVDDPEHGRCICTLVAGHEGKHLAGISGDKACAEWGGDGGGAFAAFVEHRPHLAVPGVEWAIDGPQCPSESHRWFCSRRAGHEGPHHASTGDGLACASWPQAAPAPLAFNEANALKLYGGRVFRLLGRIARTARDQGWKGGLPTFHHPKGSKGAEHPVPYWNLRLTTGEGDPGRDVRIFLFENPPKSGKLVWITLTKGGPGGRELHRSAYETDAPKCGDWAALEAEWARFEGGERFAGAPFPPAPAQPAEDVA